MLAWEKACAVPLRTSCHCSSSVVVKKERRPRLHVRGTSKRSTGL
jgi:hypothetical protein